MISSVLLPFIFAFSASAEVPAICSNLSAVTCADGVRDDGTGVSLVSDSAAFAKQEFERMEPLIRSSFATTLASAEGKRLRTLAAEACYLKGSPECKDLNAISCQPKLLSCFSRLYRTAEMNPSLASLYENERDEARFFNAEAALQLVQDPSYVKVANEITAQNLVNIPQDVKDKVEKQIFPDVKVILRKRISELPIADETRKALDERIKTIKFGGIECPTVGPSGMPVVDYSTRLAESLLPNAQYDKANHHFQICPAYLRHSTSDFDLASLIAHELAHSIDPCSLGGGEMAMSKRAMAYAKPDKVIEDQYLRKNFISCFRSPSSVGAKEFRLFDPPLEGADEAMIADDLNRLCEFDQINEAVSDWFAAETLAAYIPMRSARVKPPLTTNQIRTGVSNVFRNLCSKDPSAHEEASHPDTDSRLNSIFLVQPKIRALIGCPAELSGKKYCDIQNPVSLDDSAPSKAAPKSTSPVRNRADQ